jgi:phosphohistidine phosphatase
MKTLFLMRHAKSSWDDPGRADHDRPLKPRGIAAARRMGRLFLELDAVPERILCSTALRATQTLDLLREVWSLEPRRQPVMQLDPALYHADPDTWQRTVAEVSDTATRVLLIGHNPGLEDWLARLIGRRETLPTAAVARIELEMDRWHAIAEGPPTTLQGLWRPRELSARDERGNVSPPGDWNLEVFTHHRGD